MRLLESLHVEKDQNINKENKTTPTKNPPPTQTTTTHKLVNNSFIMNSLFSPDSTIIATKNYIDIKKIMKTIHTKWEQCKDQYDVFEKDEEVVNLFHLLNTVYRNCMLGIKLDASEENNNKGKYISEDNNTNKISPAA